jgi:hypothetical protein
VEEAIMDLGSAPVLRVIRGTEGLWEVQKAGFATPLSCFESRQDAKDYAEDLADSKPGFVVEVYGEDGRLQSTMWSLGDAVSL